VNLPVPETLTPSKITTFRNCGLAFRFDAVDRLPRPPTPQTAVGNIVHRALELLFAEDRDRSRRGASECLTRAWSEWLVSPEFLSSEWDQEAPEMWRKAQSAIDGYYELEDPFEVRPVGLELRLEARIEGVRVRGVLDRLEQTDEGWVVTDYKTGKAPTDHHEMSSLIGVMVYALLCEEALGFRPDRVRLLHLAERAEISAVPTEARMTGARKRIAALWAAVEHACEREDFRPKPGPLCGWCSYKPLCPAWGGVLPQGVDGAIVGR
jgi:putative RecB family exonuclease